MSCADLEKLIALEVAGDLPAREAAQVQAHLNECTACRSFAEELAADLQWLQSAHQEPSDRSVLHQIRVGVVRQLESRQSRWNYPFGGLTPISLRWQWIVTAAAVAILLASAIWWSGSPEKTQPAIASHSGAPTQSPANTKAPSDREAEPSVANAEPRTQAGKHADALPLLPQSAPVRKATASAATQDSNQMPASERSTEPQTEITPPPQLARADPTSGSHPGAHPASAERIVGNEQIEIVTALLTEPPQESKEAVMLKIPTSNPGIVLYWLMDDAQQLEATEENKGD